MSLQELKADEEGQRLDSFLAARLKIPRSHAKRLILERRVSLDGRTGEAGTRLKAGTLVQLAPPSSSWHEPPGKARPGQPRLPSFESRLLWEDGDLLILDKPAGLLTHPKSPGWIANSKLAAEDPEPNLAGFLYLARPSLRQVPRLGIAHRLDRGTTGVMAVAKNPKSLSVLLAEFKERTVSKVYRAIVRGAPEEDEATIEAPVGRRSGQGRVSADPLGRPALTEVRVLKRARGAALVEARPRTGRTHQIRAHLAFWGHPVVGDPDFKTGRGAKDLLPTPPRPLLHAYTLSFEHPRLKKPLLFKAPIPRDFKAYWSNLETVRNKARA